MKKIYSVEEFEKDFDNGVDMSKYFDFEKGPATFSYPVRINIEVTWSAEDQVFIANALQFKGCKTHGATRSEALKMAKAAIESYLKIGL